MNIEYVSVENSKYHREYFSPDSIRTEIYQQNSFVKNPNIITRHETEPNSPLIARIIKIISDKGL
jgi:hypothetical protein